jgi:hypothetical protein
MISGGRNEIACRSQKIFVINNVPENAWIFDKIINAFRKHILNI